MLAKGVSTTSSSQPQVAELKDNIDDLQAKLRESLGENEALRAKNDALSLELKTALSTSLALQAENANLLHMLADSRWDVRTSW